MDNIDEIFCTIDDFCQVFAKELKKRTLPSPGQPKRNRSGQMVLSELMVIVVLFHQSHYKDFKYFYLHCVQRQLKSAFPQLVSYSRFIQLMPRLWLPLTVFLSSCCRGKPTGISFVDSTKLAVCGNKRIKRNKVFNGLAKIGKSSMGWFYGFKLHIVTNDQGDLLSFTVTPGNTDDREVLDKLTRTLFGKLFGDKGYISQLWCDKLREKNIQLITSIRKNMKNKLVPWIDKVLLRKRSIIETIIDQLKNISQIEHTRHRSSVNCMVNLVAGLIAYAFKPKKPSLVIWADEMQVI